MWTNLRDMDFPEKASFREAVKMSVALDEHAVMNRMRIERLLESPYFGRVDFRTAGWGEGQGLLRRCVQTSRTPRPRRS
jgi:DNA helicase-2/ATP-dependent DNA helicase PcrA